VNAISDNLKEMEAEIGDLLKDLLLNESSIRYRKQENVLGFRVVSSAGDYEWLPMEESGRQLRSKILEEYRCFASIMRTLLRGQPEHSLKLFDKSAETITRIIGQKSPTPLASTHEALARATKEIGVQTGLLTSLYDGSSGRAVYVPDTNALLFNIQLEDWRFPDSPKFTLILIPSVLKELDELKILHRNENVREKADSLISRIKGYRARGSLTKGVTLVRDVSEIMAIATEPDMTRSLPWLDPQSEDDRILAATLEIMRERPRSAVTLVTRDINLQNKAEFARIPFSEPPDVPTTNVKYDIR
jgi:hypothetical protein